LGVSQ
jgi:hypothetical protein